MVDISENQFNMHGMRNILVIAVLMFFASSAIADELSTGLQGAATAIAPNVIIVKQNNKTFRVKLNGMLPFECTKCIFPGGMKYDVTHAETDVLHRAIDGLPKAKDGQVICTILGKTGKTYNGVCYGQYGDLAEKVISEGWAKAKIIDIAHPSYRELHLFRVQVAAQANSSGFWSGRCIDP
jgi:hypothetical protein